VRPYRQFVVDVATFIDIQRFQVSGFGCQQTALLNPDTESAFGGTPAT
jgi:hypothetical protein